MPPVRKPTESVTPTQTVSIQDHLETLATPVQTINAPIVKVRPIVYPKYEVKVYACPDDRGNVYEGPITYDIMRKWLRWEREDNYTKRLLAKNPNMKESKTKFGDKYLFIIPKGCVGEGEKVQCWNNPKNRDFDLKWAEAIKQDILTRDFQLNLENIIFSYTGAVHSGQHRAIGFMLAVLEWRDTHQDDGSGFWDTYWEVEPYIESTVAFGAREDSKVMRTYDNVKTRTLADTIGTSPTFAEGDIKTEEDKRHHSKILDNAIDCLWKRTKQVVSKDSFIRYQTHSASLEFFDRHPKLKDCVKHIFKQNGNRVLSNLKISLGDSAAMMYLMGSCRTDSENYHYLNSPKKEDQLDWTFWDKAREFWEGLVDPKSTLLEPVRYALKHVLDPHTGDRVPSKVKCILISKAWNAYVEDEPIMAVDLDIGPYLKWSNERGRTLIVEETTVGGIDCGIVKGGGELEDQLPTPDEIQAVKDGSKKEIAEMIANAQPFSPEEPNGEDGDSEENVESIIVKPRAKNELYVPSGEIKAELAKVQAILDKKKPSTMPPGDTKEGEAKPVTKAPKKPTLKK